MSIAVVKGKVSNAGSEDLLTASVFGPLRYLPFNEYLKPILEQSRNLDGKNIQLPNSDDMPTLDFWPTRYRREPDLELEMPAMKIFVEVKFHSGKSGDGEHDQLANQYEDLYKSTDRKKAVIYLTKHRSMPKEELQKSISNVNPSSLTKKFQDSLFWLSWFDMWSFISMKNKQVSTHPEKLILQDLCELMEKQGLAHFTGFTITNKDVVRESKEEKIFYNEQRKR